MLDPITLYLTFAMLATLWLDLTRYMIPNWLVGSLLLLYPVAVYVAPQAVDWPMALAGFGLIFAVGCLVFALRMMGGGDVKLIAVLALWVGWQELGAFIALFAIFGGIFSLLVLMMRKAEPYLPFKGKPPRLLQKDAPIPYGVAIAGAFLWMMWTGKIAVLSSSIL